MVAELHSTAGDTIEESALATEEMLNGPLVEKDGYDGRAMEEGNESDYEPRSESAFETDSESESGPPTLDLEDADADIAPGDAVAQPNDFYAKTFLENSWNRQCSCAQEETTWSDGRPVHGLQQMAEYWQGLGVPDAIGTKTVSATTIQGEAPHPEWLSVLSGGDQRPRLCFEKSRNSTPNFARTWDVDSMIIRASCLSINRGLYVSYSFPPMRNMRANVHVFPQGKTLHAIPHLRLVSGRQSPQFCVYVFFPGISHPCRTSSYLTRAERRTWVDNVLLPAIRYTCPPDVIQYHPRSFDDVESKAYSRRRENCSGGVQNNMDMHHFLPQRYLKAIWTHMMQITAHVDLAIFRGLFLVLSAKNIKLEDRTSTFQDCQGKVSRRETSVISNSH